MNFIDTKKLENSKGQGQGGKTNKANVAQNATKSNLDKRFEALGKVGNADKKCAINVTLDKEVLDRLNSYCGKHFSSRSAIINSLITDWLDNQKD